MRAERVGRGPKRQNLASDLRPWLVLSYIWVQHRIQKEGCDDSQEEVTFSTVSSDGILLRKQPLPILRLHVDDPSPSVLATSTLPKCQESWVLKAFGFFKVAVSHKLQPSHPYCAGHGLFIVLPLPESQAVHFPPISLHSIHTFRRELRSPDIQLHKPEQDYFQTLDSSYFLCWIEISYYITVFLLLCQYNYSVKGTGLHTADKSWGAALSPLLRGFLSVSIM